MVLIDMAQPAAAWELLLDRCLDHVSGCSVVGMACQFVMLPRSSDGGSSRRRRSSSSNSLQLGMLQVFAAATTSTEQAADIGSSRSSQNSSSSSGGSSSFARCIYLLALPDDPEVTQPVVQQLLGPLFTSQQLVKVMHDPRQDAAVLQQQYGVELQGVLDTQLLAGVVAAADGITPAGAAGNPTNGSVLGAAADAGSIAEIVNSLRDVTINALYQQYGFDHPHNQAVHAMFDMDDRLWYRRPLTTQLLAYAADDVRYLLPVAAALLQQLPTAALGFSSAVLVRKVAPAAASGPDCATAR
jgi:hypothetical protein